MQKTLFFFSFLMVFLACMFFASSAVHSASIKEQMTARMPAINSLKDSGIIGEDNRGFLVFRTGDTAQKSLIDAENKDRMTIYEAIGKKQGASAELVGQRRAKMIAENGSSGHWFQRPDGSWYKK